MKDREARLMIESEAAVRRGGDDTLHAVLRETQRAVVSFRREISAEVQAYRALIDELAARQGCEVVWQEQQPGQWTIRKKEKPHARRD